MIQIYGIYSQTKGSVHKARALHLCPELSMIATGAPLHDAMRRLKASTGRAASGVRLWLAKNHHLHLFPVLKF